MTLGGLKRLSSDHSVFAKTLETDQVVIIIVYIDDFLYFGLDIAEINSIKIFLSETNKMKDLGTYCQFTGLKIKRQIEEKTICLSQGIDVRKAPEYSGMSDCKPVNSQIVVNTDFTKNPQEPTNKEFIRTYQSPVRTNIRAYICGRPNLWYAVSTLSRFSSNPITRHRAAVKQLYWHLQATKDFKIVYRGGLTEKPGLEMNTDADRAKDKETRKSTSGYIIILAGCSVSWLSKRQTTITQSSTEVVYIAASEASKESVLISRLLE